MDITDLINSITFNDEQLVFIYDHNIINETGTMESIFSDKMHSVRFRNWRKLYGFERVRNWFCKPVYGTRKIYYAYIIII